MPHHNKTAWDDALLAKLRSPPYDAMRQGGIEDDNGPGDRGDDLIADMLNEETVELPDEYIDTPASVVVRYLAMQNVWVKIKSAARGGDEGAETLVDLLMVGGSIDTSNSEARDQLVGLLTSLGSLLSADQVAAVTSMAVRKRRIPYWQSIGATGPFNRYDFMRARYE